MTGVTGVLQDIRPETELRLFAYSYTCLPQTDPQLLAFSNYSVMPLDDRVGLFGRLIYAVLLLLAVNTCKWAAPAISWKTPNLPQYPTYKIVYNLYFDPLAKFPGPRSWSATRLPYIWLLLTVKIVHDVESLHRRYGPVVRVAPNEISFRHVQAWVDIFRPWPGHLQFPKDPLWC